MKIGLFIGSLRQGSFNRKIAHLLMELAPKTLALEIIEIGHLSFYNQDLDENPPESWHQFRQKIKSLDGCIFLSPEYNRSTSPVLKNALDIGSRPYGQSVWAKKPCAVISASISSAGAFGANHHLRQSFVFLDMPCMNQPEMYLSHIDRWFDAAGKLADPTTAHKLLNDFLSAFERWVNSAPKV